MAQIPSAGRAVVLVTGMSGTGKSTALEELARRGHRVLDTDYGGFIEDVPADGGTGSERLWRADRIDALLADHTGGTLFVSGCVANQGAFYPRFDAVVLLSAPAEVILERVAARRTNDFGKTGAERTLILQDLMAVEPLLRAGATAEIDARRPVNEVADELESIAGGGYGQRMRLNRSVPPVQVVPVLVYPDVRAAVAWLEAALGCSERVQIGDAHRAQLALGSGAVIVADVHGDRVAPRDGVVTSSVMVRVDDVNAMCARARDQGARVLMEPTDFEYGERQCTIEDPFGHRWTLSETLRDAAPEEWGGVTVNGGHG